MYDLYIAYIQVIYSLSGILGAIESDGKQSFNM